MALNAAGKTLSQTAMVLASIPGVDLIDVFRKTLSNILSEDADQRRLELEEHQMAGRRSGTSDGRGFEVISVAMNIEHDDAITWWLW